MPTYEYRCPKCGNAFEKFERKISDKRTARCPKCGAAAQRMISGGAGFLFKGSGFYITDYKRGGAKPEGSDAKSESKPESKTSEKPSQPESKPEKKTDDKPKKHSSGADS